jgi:hypothetical protein
MTTSSESPPVWDEVINDQEVLASMPLLGQKYFTNNSNKANGNKYHELILIKSEMTLGYYPPNGSRSVQQKKSCNRKAIMVIDHLNLDDYFHRNVVMKKFTFRKKMINGLTLIEPVHLVFVTYEQNSPMKPKLYSTTMRVEKIPHAHLIL